MNHGLVNVDIYFHDTDTIAQCHKYMDNTYTPEKGYQTGYILWKDFFNLSDHPNYDIYASKRYVASRDLNADQPLVTAVYWELENDERGIGTLYLGSGDASIMNNLS